MICTSAIATFVFLSLASAGHAPQRCVSESSYLEAKLEGVQFVQRDAVKRRHPAPEANSTRTSRTTGLSHLVGSVSNATDYAGNGSSAPSPNHSLAASKASGSPLRSKPDSPPGSPSAYPLASSLAPSLAPSPPPPRAPYLALPPAPSMVLSPELNRLRLELAEQMHAAIDLHHADAELRRELAELRRTARLQAKLLRRSMRVNAELVRQDVELRRTAQQQAELLNRSIQALSPDVLGMTAQTLDDGKPSRRMFGLAATTTPHPDEIDQVITDVGRATWETEDIIANLFGIEMRLGLFQLHLIFIIPLLTLGLCFGGCMFPQLDKDWQPVTGTRGLCRKAIVYAPVWALFLFFLFEMYVLTRTGCFNVFDLFMRYVAAGLFVIAAVLTLVFVIYQKLKELLHYMQDVYHRFSNSVHDKMEDLHERVHEKLEEVHDRLHEKMAVLHERMHRVENCFSQEANSCMAGITRVAYKPRLRTA